LFSVEPFAVLAKTSFDRFTATFWRLLGVPQPGATRNGQARARPDDRARLGIYPLAERVRHVSKAEADAPEPLVWTSKFVVWVFAVAVTTAPG
jgi:hypothetical protein